jgi:glyoxylase-like metal-dependent hydrolase (beta-lactamase superfamily II)
MTSLAEKPWLASSDDALSDGAEDEHGEVDQATDDHDHAEQERGAGHPLVDPAATRPPAAKQIVRWIEATGENLTTIDITHGHGDDDNRMRRSQGASS